MPETILRVALRSLWTTVEAGARRRTLARLLQHRRQFEPWWKAELAAHLWDHIGLLGPNTDVWLEAHDRSDITIAESAVGAKEPCISGDGLCIPVELKMAGTWCGASPSEIDKALGDSSKKCLAQDMRDLRDGRRRASPFGLVGLLVTHVGQSSDEVYERYLERARDLGHENGLELMLDEPIDLPQDEVEGVAAHQLFWLAREAVAAHNPRSNSAAAIHAAITSRQTRWARKKGFATDSRGWFESFDDNLVEALDPDVHHQLETADGNELAGKLRAPWSSSALVLNFFYPWKRRDKKRLAEALGRSSIDKFEFERCHPTGNRHARANLDLEITSSGAPALAIESKFREPFASHEPLAASYLAKPELWTSLPRCYQLAHEITRNPRAFERLDVAQLLKHVLGLARSYRTQFELLYLWFDPTSLVGSDAVKPIAQHRDELERFEAAIRPEVNFRHTTYQKLFDRLGSAAASDFAPYLAARYFGDSD